MFCSSFVLFHFTRFAERRRSDRMGDHLTPVILWLWPGLHLSPLVSSSWGLLVATQKIIWSWGVWVSVIVHDWVSEREGERDVEQKRTISKTASDTSLSFIHQSVWPAAAAGAAQRNCHTQKSAKRETKMDDGEWRERQRERETERIDTEQDDHGYCHRKKEMSR